MIRPIAIDNREQRGYSWEGEQETIPATLRAGDYSLFGLENRVAVERKSLDDWIGTILRGRERFRRELQLLEQYDFAAVIIEATPQDIMSGHYKSEIAPNALLGLTFEYAVRFAPVQFHLAGDRPHARLICEKLLRFAEARCDERDRAALAIGELVA
jgi:DNA excision repair protein ERCC-4